MKRLTYSQMVATVFVLGWATCPMVFAAERGKQEGKREARRVIREVVAPIEGVTPVVVTERVGSLLDQMRGLDLGRKTALGETMVLERPEGIYVFNNLARDEAGNLSGLVAVYDANGAPIGEVNILRVAVLDDNRIDFAISVSAVAAATGAAPDWSGVGSIAGLNDGTRGVGLAFVSANDEDTRPLLVNYGQLAVSGTPESPLPLFSSLVSLPVGGVATHNDELTERESCEGGSVASVLGWVALCVAVVIVVVVAVSCYAYCFPRACC